MFTATTRWIKYFSVMILLDYCGFVIRRAEQLFCQRCFARARWPSYYYQDVFFILLLKP